MTFETKAYKEMASKEKDMNRRRTGIVCLVFTSTKFLALILVMKPSRRFFEKKARSFKAVHTEEIGISAMHSFLLDITRE